MEKFSFTRQLQRGYVAALASLLLLVSVLIFEALLLRSIQVAQRIIAVNAVKTGFALSILKKGTYPTLAELSKTLSAEHVQTVIIKTVKQGKISYKSGLDVGMKRAHYLVATYKDSGCKIFAQRASDRVKCVGGVVAT